MTDKHNAKTTEVYTSTSGFSELVSSSVFYPVVVLTVILGFTSIYGFLQNPHKLKSVVEIITKKVLVSQKTPIAYKNNYHIDSSFKKQEEHQYTDQSRYSIFTAAFDASLNNSHSVKSITPVSFEYDITSKQFWGDLDSSRIESAIEESQRQNNGPIIIGTPLEHSNSVNKGDSKYSMKAALIRL